MNSKKTITLAKIVATSFGFGYAPKAPGTFGALFGLLCSVFILKFHHDISNQFHASGVLITYFVGVWSVKKLHSEWGDDPSKVVIDETCGYWLSLLFLPLNYTTIMLAFVFFRIFDIWKPLGIRKIDQLKNAHSVMLDDVVAGVYSNIAIQMVLYFMTILNFNV